VVAFFRHADGARVAVREVEADGTKADLLLRSRNGSGKTMRSLHIHVQDMVGEPRRRLRPDAGQTPGRSCAPSAAPSPKGGSWVAARRRCGRGCAPRRAA